NGTPWYINDLIDDEPSERGIIHFMVLGDDHGPGHYRGITGLVPKQLEHNWFVTREANGVVGTGIAEQSINIVEEIPSTPYTINLNIPINASVSVPTLPVMDTWVSWPTGIAMGQ